MNISSGSVFGPVQPQVPDFSALDNKNFASFSPSDFGGGTQAISYGNDAFGGTDFDSLSGIPGSGNDSGDGQMDNMQLANELLSSLMPMLMQLSQIYQMLQQLFAQQQNSSADAGAGSGGGAGGAGAFPQGDSGQQPLATPTNAAQQPVTPTANATPQQPVTPSANTTPQQPLTAQSNASQTAPTPESAPTAGGGVPVTKGKSGMYLPEPLKKYEDDIMHAARETNQPPEVLAGQIWQESRGKADAVTTNGGNGLSDSGVMQVNSNTFAELQSKYPHLLGPNASPSNSSDSIMAGALYLKEQRETFGGDLGAGLRGYNSGPGNVNVKDLTDISKTGTGDATYVGKVLNFADIFSSGKGTLPA